MPRHPKDPVRAWLEGLSRTVGETVLQELFTRGGPPVAPAFDPGAVFALDGRATRGQVDAAFRAVLAIAHPDRDTGDAEWFKRLTEARRALYAARGWKGK